MMGLPMMVFWRRTDIFAKQLTLTFSLDNDTVEKQGALKGLVLGLLRTLNANLVVVGAYNTYPK
jgi:hypothetical protein